MSRIELTRVEPDVSGRPRIAGRIVVLISEIVHIVERPGITTLTLKTGEVLVRESFSEIDCLMALSKNRRV